MVGGTLAPPGYVLNAWAALAKSEWREWRELRGERDSELGFVCLAGVTVLSDSDSVC